MAPELPLLEARLSYSEIEEGITLGVMQSIYRIYHLLFVNLVYSKGVYSFNKKIVFKKKISLIRAKFIICDL